MADKLGRDRLTPPKKDHHLRGGPAQRAILSFIRRRPILPTKYVSKLLGSSYSHRTHLTLLTQSGYLYHPRDSLKVDRLKLLNRDMVWSLTKEGDEFYENIGGTEPHRNFNSYYQHAVGVSVLGALFDLFAKEHNLTLTIHGDKPETWNDELISDEPPFTIKGAFKKIEFLGFEYDCASETHTTILDKIDAYARWLESGEHGMKNPFVPITTTSEKRMLNIMKHLAAYGDTGRRFLLNWFPKMEDNTFPTATGTHVECWQRFHSLGTREVKRKGKLIEEKYAVPEPFHLLEALQWTSTSSKPSSPKESELTSRLEQP